MTAHDNSYKLLFSHPEMVRDLLEGFVHEPWVAELDFSTLEIVSGSYVAEDLRDRQDDVVWRLRFKDDWLYLYILLEFQSTVDAHMAVRMLTYLGLLYQDLIKQKQFTPRGKLPPILPIVLYNGKPRWQAAQNISDLIDVPPNKLHDYTPQLKYLLLDEGAVDESGPLALRNLSAAQPVGCAVQSGKKPKHRQHDAHRHRVDRLAGGARARLIAPRLCRVDAPRTATRAHARCHHAPNGRFIGG
ncbi:Rpn family recombination-promoting nuclease/putative transposase [Rhodoferax sp.]|uniref:Rpn family recombination-promoting nuclease/putative transposase n=1 Tax=Rhodoferax sp. TaxID=50421 RepID=UPI002769C4CE|nr:Rpn family recombination-promoting nuclease/putative transposase [Rhodoferax sp.]